MSDQAILGISEVFQYRFCFVDLTETARKTIGIHSLSRDMSVFVSKTMMGALFLAKMTKNQQRVSIQWKDEYSKQALAYSDRYGKMKAVGYSGVYPEGDIRNEFILGKGILKVIRWDVDSEHYQSYTNLVEDTFEVNFQKYINESEQIRAVVGMEVNSDVKDENFFAKGVFFEALPDATEEGYRFLAETILPLFKKESFWQSSNNEMLTKVSEAIGEQLETLSIESPQFLCDCSRFKVADIIASLGKVEANSILNDVGKIEITCEFCRTPYEFGSDDMIKLFPDET